METFHPAYIRGQSGNIPFTSHEVHVANWLQQMQSKFKFKTNQLCPEGGEEGQRETQPVQT